MAKLNRIPLTVRVSIAVIALAIMAAAIAPLISPYDPNAQVLGDRLLPPGSPGHVLGTDPLGRDILSRLIYGARTSILVATSALLLAGSIGVVMGLISGYAGGTIDHAIMRLADLQLSIPYLVLAITFVAVLGTASINLIVILGLVGWVFYGRIIRAEVLAMKNQDFLDAARITGTPGWQIVLRHVIPNIRSTAIVLATVEAPRMILLEAALSFLGLGVQPPTASWGNMVAGGRDYIAGQWWLTAIPGTAIVLVALALSLVGDWLRDALDPRADSARELEVRI